MLSHGGNVESTPLEGKLVDVLGCATLAFLVEVSRQLTLFEEERCLK